MSNAESTPTRIIPALGGLYDGLASFAYPLVRVTCGALLIPHGYMKLFGGAAKGAHRSSWQ